jgi:hypothetical protein
MPRSHRELNSTACRDAHKVAKWIAVSKCKGTYGDLSKVEGMLTDAYATGIRGESDGSSSDNNHVSSLRARLRRPAYESISTFAGC